MKRIKQNPKKLALKAEVVVHLQDVHGGAGAFAVQAARMIYTGPDCSKFDCTSTH
jgi:hypothetical protein